MSSPMYDVPQHFPIGVDADGRGPLDETEPGYDRTMCWCGNDECELWRDS